MTELDRPLEWQVPLFVHVLGAMAMVGALLLALTVLVHAWRTEEAASLRLGYRTLLVAALPSWLVMRVSAEWVLAESVFEDETWVGIGYGIGDLSLPLLVAATVLARMSARRAAAGGRVRAAVVVVGLTLVLAGIAVWAMTAKPA